MEILKRKLFFEAFSLFLKGIIFRFLEVVDHARLVGFSFHVIKHELLFEVGVHAFGLLDVEETRGWLAARRVERSEAVGAQEAVGTRGR